jgi:hypothetical protein
MTYRCKFQRDMARAKRRHLWRCAAYQALAASAVLAALGLVVL